MHRTEGDGYRIEGLKRRHVDQNLPATPGTTGSAEFFNALQEELINAIEYAGLTISADGATDRSIGWDQLKQAIFESSAIDTTAIKNNAITNDKILGLSFDKLTAGTTSISETVGDYTYRTTIDGNQTLLFQLRRENNTTSIDETCGLSYDDIFSKQYDNLLVKQEVNLNYDRLLMNDQSNISYTRNFYFDSAYLYIDKNVSSSSTVTYVEISESTGLTHKSTVSSILNESVILNYNGLKFKRSGYAIQHMIVDCSSGWSGSGPYTNTVNLLNMPTNATCLMATLSARNSTSKITYFEDYSDSNIPKSMYIDMSTYQVSISTDFNPANCDRIYLTVWYTRDIT